MRICDVSTVQSHTCGFYMLTSSCMHGCDRYFPSMDVRKVRHALRMLRSGSGKSLHEIDGLDRATVHRIENVKGDPDYSPGFSSVALIVEACGSTLGRFFTDLDDVAANPHAAALLEQIADEETLRQLRAFLSLPTQAREAVAAAASRTFAPAPAPVLESKPSPTPASHTKRRRARRRSPGGRKTGT